MEGAKEGIVVAGDQDKGNDLTQLSYPIGVIVDEQETVYVVENGDDRVMRWFKEARQGSIVVGGNGRGEQANQLHCPWGLSIDRQGNIYVADASNKRVQKFNIDPSSNM